MNTRVLIRLAGPVMFAALSLTGCKLPWGGGRDSTAIVLSGTLEAREVNVAFQVKGRITALDTDEGHPVAQGSRVARLDPSDYQAALDRTDAESRARHAALAELEAGTRRQELEAQRATLRRTRAQLAYSRAELKRVSHLSSRHLASQDQLDQARLALSVSQAAVEEAAQQLDLLQEGARKEEIDQARAEYAAAQAAVVMARQNLAYTSLDSPVSGIVASRLAEAGEVVAAAQPVFTIDDLSHPWVRAYLPETDLPRVKLGEPVQVRVDGLPGKVFTGRLSYISPAAEFTPKTVQTQELRVDLVYRVKVDVDNPAGLLKVGMPADVTVEPAT